MGNAATAILSFFIGYAIGWVLILGAIRLLGHRRK